MCFLYAKLKPKGGPHMPKVSKYLTHLQPKLNLIKAWYRNASIDVDVAKNLNVVTPHT